MEARRVAISLLGLALLPACSGEGAAPGGSGGAGQAGGSSLATTTSVAMSATTGASPSLSSSAVGGGGAGGAAMGGGGSTSTTSAAGGGGSGGGGDACLDPSVAAAYFTIDRSEFCIVAAYPDPGASWGSWGRHLGLLTLDPSWGDTQSINVQRWHVSGSALVADETVLSWVGPLGFAMGFSDLPDGRAAAPWEQLDGNRGFAFLGAQAVVDDHGALWSSFHQGPVALGTAASMRLLYGGVSELDGGVGAAGVYAADFSAGALTGSVLVAELGTSAGNIAADRAGNVVAVGTVGPAPYVTELRGFEATTVAPGGGPTAGQTLLSLPGAWPESTLVAALSPEPGKPGLVVVQAEEVQPDGTLVYSDLRVVPYSQSAGALVASPVDVLLTLVDRQAVFFLADDAGRLWVGSTDGTTLFVLRR